MAIVVQLCLPDMLLQLGGFPALWPVKGGRGQGVSPLLIGVSLADWSVLRDVDVCSDDL